MAEAVLAMRDGMAREEEPSFVIRDPKICEGTDKLRGRVVKGVGHLDHV